MQLNARARPRPDTHIHTHVLVCHCLSVSPLQILRPRSRPDVAAANIAAAVSLGAAERAPLGDTLWNAVTGVVPALEDISQSDCCASVRTWTANK